MHTQHVWLKIGIKWSFYVSAHLIIYLSLWNNWSKAEHDRNILQRFLFDYIFSLRWFRCWPVYIRVGARPTGSYSTVIFVPGSKSLRRFAAAAFYILAAAPRKYTGSDRARRPLMAPRSPPPALYENRKGESGSHKQDAGFCDLCSLRKRGVHYFNTRSTPRHNARSFMAFILCWALWAKPVWYRIASRRWS